MVREFGNNINTVLLLYDEYSNRVIFSNFGLGIVVVVVGYLT